MEEETSSGRAGAKTQSEPRSAPANAPEDELVLRLLQKIKAASGQIYFTTLESRQVFSDCHFLELADSLPPEIESLCHSSAQTLSEDAIRGIIPTDDDPLAEEIYAATEHRGKYELLSKTHRCIVDVLYYDYLKMR